MTAETQRLRRLDLHLPPSFSDDPRIVDAVSRAAVAKSLTHIALQQIGNTGHGVPLGADLHVPTNLIYHLWALMS